MLTESWSGTKPSNPVPALLSPRHKLVAYLTALGKTVTQLQEETGYSRGRIVCIRQAPAFRLELERIQREIQQATLEKLADRIIQEGHPTLDKLVELRDQAANEPVQLGAAKELWRTLVPERSIVREDKTLRIVLAREDLKPLIQAIEEDEAEQPPLKA
jgi:hypothetical protein